MFDTATSDCIEVNSSIGSGCDVSLGVASPLAQLQRAVDALSEWGVSADGQSLVVLRREIDRLSALLVEAEVRFDSGEVWRNDGAGRFVGGCVTVQSWD